MKARFGAVMAVEALPDSAAFASRYGGDGGFVLVRPDGYIGCTAGVADAAAVGRYLQKTLGSAMIV